MHQNMFTLLLLSSLGLTSLTMVESYVMVPLYHPMSYILPPTHLGLTPYIQISPPIPAPELSYSTLEKGLRFSAKRKTPLDHEVENLESGAVSLGRIAGRNVDLCYFLGNDIFTSHVPCNPNWGDGKADTQVL